MPVVRPRSSVSPRSPRRSGSTAAVALAALLAVATSAGPAAAAGPLTALKRTEPLAPGVTLHTLKPLMTHGFANADVLEVRMGTAGAHLGLLTQPTVSFTPIGGSTTPSALARAGGAIGAINGDGYDNGNSFAPNHAQIGGGLLRSSGPATEPRPWPTAGVTKDGLGAIQRLLFTGSITRTAVSDAAVTTLPLTAVNTYTAGTPGGVSAFTSQWGAASRNRTGGTNLTEVRVVDGVVTAVRVGAPGTGAIAANELYLVGREAGGTTLQQYAVGDRIALDYKLKTADGPAPDYDFALGGHALATPLVTDGLVTATDDTAGAANRTAIGFSADHRTAYLAAVRGTSLTDLGSFMRAIGAADAVNLGGGGSTTLSARSAGTTDVAVRTGSERNENAAIGVFTNPATGVPAALLPKPAGGAPARAVPGGRVAMDAAVVDAAWAPATPTAPITWSASRGSIDAAGVFTAPSEPGEVEITATSGGATGTTRLRVLSTLRTVSVSQDKLSFANADASPAALSLDGVDVEGYTAPVDAGAAKLEYDQAVITAEALPDGRVQVTPKATGSTVLWITDGAATVSVAVRVGDVTLPSVVPASPPADRLVSVDGSSNRAPWTFAALSNLGIDTADDAATAVAARAVRVARASGTDLILLNGVTASGSSVQATVAKTALEDAGCQVVGDGESVASVPPTDDRVACVAVPGTSDRVGGSVSGLTDAFGPAYRTFDLHGVRFVLLDSSGGTLRATPAQLAVLRDALADAETDDAIASVAVVTARPTSDVLGEGTRALTDANEVAMLQGLLRRFQEDTSKSTVLIAGESRSAGVRRGDGLAEVGVPPVGGDPRGEADAGGFNGWTRFGVDTEASDAGQDWISAEMRPVGSRADLDAGRRVTVGDWVAVHADAVQGARSVPLRYPATPRWSGSGGLAIGSGAVAVRDARDAGKIAILDPVTARLTGLREGQVTLTVTIDGQGSDAAVTADTSVDVVPVDPGTGPDPDPGPGDPKPPVTVPVDPPVGSGGILLAPVLTVVPPGSVLPLRTGNLSPRLAAARNAVKVTVKVPAGSIASATIQLRTKLKVAAGRGKQQRTRTVVVGRGSVTLGNGARRTVTVRLTAAGRAQLKRVRRLEVAVVITAKDARNRDVVTTKTVTVKR